MDLVTILLAVVQHLAPKGRERKKELRRLYKLIWRDSADLQPEDVLGIRASDRYGFKRYYYPRDHDREIAQRILAGKNVLVVGNPLAGKSRAVFQTLRFLKKRHAVIIPNREDIRIEEFRIPGRWAEWKKPILVLDDIDKYAAKQNFTFLLEQFTRKDVIIVATCRSGPELERAKSQLESYLGTLFEEPIEIKRMPDNAARQVSQEAGVQPPDGFDGNIGSLFVRIDTMRERYEQCKPETKRVLQSIKRLYLAGIYKGNEVFSIDRIRLVCEKTYETTFSNPDWRDLLESVQNLGFVDLDGEQLKVEETYLQSVIPDDTQRLENFQAMTGIFANDPEALYYIGYQAYEVGQYDLEIAAYHKVAIKAFELALLIWTIDRYPEKYATTQNNLGDAYRILGEVADRAANCRKAIDAFSEALKVRTLEQFPIQYAMTQNNLGNAYQTLGEVEEKADNCRKAIDAFRDALKVRTLEQFPMDYAMTRNNLGTAYQTLGQVEDRADNCRKAIDAYSEALKVYTLEQFPMDYAMTRNNLGAAYKTLAEVEEKADNCRKAIDACKEALKVYTLEQFPIQYATTRNNLGAAYWTMAEAQDKGKNCQRALDSYTEALRVAEEQGLTDFCEDIRHNIKRLKRFMEGNTEAPDEP